MKIEKALIIRRQQVEISKQYAEECAKSCEKHSLDYEFIDAVEFLSCDEAFKSVGAFKKENYKNTMGNCCCHSSHIKCWDRIVELNKVCIILEHDALIVGNVKSIDIPDMAVVTFGHRVKHKDSYSPKSDPQKLVEIPRAIGVHACGLTPNTAKWLSDDAKKNGVDVGVDRWLMMQKKSGLPLYVCEPPQAVCWVRMSTSNFDKDDRDKLDVSKPRSSVSNYKEALTPGWNEGLRPDG